MTRNFNRLETLENAVVDFENKKKSFDFWEDNSFYGLDFYNYGLWEEKHILPYYRNRGYVIDENGICSCPEWFNEGFESEEDYNEYLESGKNEYSPFEDYGESWVDPEWYAKGFNSEADYMHYLGIISGLS